jgi:hypothetical protein
MAKTTMLFGTLLLGISLVILAITQKIGSPSIFIPALVGVPLLILGFLAEKQPGNRKLLMHIAVTVGLLGALASIMPIILQISKLAKGESLDPLRAGSVFAMAILCGLYVTLCVQSFIKARKNRESINSGESA